MIGQAPAIPDPPREVRWRTCLARRWILGLLGSLLTLAGLVLLVFSWIQAGDSPFDDDVLDGGGWTATGQILAVERLDNGLWRVRYEFAAGGATVRGASFTDVRYRGMQVGEACTVEYLRERPEVNRMAGTRRAFFDPTLSRVVTALIVLGLVGLYLWIRGALSLRVALREGRLTTAQLIEVKALRLVNPPAVRVRYRFHDGLGMEHITGHCVGRGTAIGRLLLADAPREHPVIHDEGDPAVSRLVHPEDFQS